MTTAKKKTSTKKVELVNTGSKYQFKIEDVDYYIEFGEEITDAETTDGTNAYSIGDTYSVMYFSTDKTFSDFVDALVQIRDIAQK